MGVGVGTTFPPPSLWRDPSWDSSLETQEYHELELGQESRATQGPFYAFSSEKAIVGGNSLCLWNHKFFKVSGLHF